MLIEENESLKRLNPTRSVYSVIGNLCNNLQLLKNPDITISADDFYQDFHKIVFSAIYNIAFSSANAQHITEIDIDNYLAAYPKMYKIWDSNNGLRYVKDCINHTNKGTFKTSYDRLKKFSLLRLYVENGIDVSDIYNYKSNDIIDYDKSMKNVDKMSIPEILDHYSLKMMDLRGKFDVGQGSVKFKAGDGLDELLEELNKLPSFGYPFRNKMYNELFRGMRRSKFLLRSADTGAGKTRQALADICNVSCSMIYDIDKDEWIDNNGSYPSLFISTELEKKELQTTMLAFVTGVPEDVIKDGVYGDKIKERLLKGIEILKEAPIYCEYIDDFSISDIEAIIESHIIEHNVIYVAFDYIQITPKLSRTMSRDFGINLREDQVLVNFSASLKKLANKYNIYICSSTQLNRNSKDEENRDTTSLRGGSSTADKVDVGIIVFRVGEKDRKRLKHILDSGFYENPNYSHWVYKNRGGKISKCIIWTYMDLGIMREKPLFVTDYDYNLIDTVRGISINYDENAELKDIKKDINKYNSHKSYIQQKREEELEEELIF